MKRILVLLAVVIVLVSTPAFSGVLQINGNPTWNSWDSSQLSGGTFWANHSYDGNGNCNIGYYVAGVQGCNVPGFYGNGSPGDFLQYLGVGQTMFWLDQVAEVTATLNLSVTADGSDVLGWYSLADPSTLHPLFGSNDPMGKSATFQPGGAFGFYFLTGIGTFHSESLDSNSRSHFALFDARNGKYFLGLEDRTKEYDADMDFNDIGLTLEVQPVPEPASVLLLGIGLLASGARLRRRKVIKKL